MVLSALFLLAVQGSTPGRRPSRRLSMVLSALFLLAVQGSTPLFSVTAGFGCSVNFDGTCVTDGSGNYGNSERCTITANTAVTLSTTEFSTESCCDRITVGGLSYKGSSGPSGVSMSAGETMTWYTDGSVTNTGFTICGTSTSTSTSAASGCVWTAFPDRYSSGYANGHTTTYYSVTAAQAACNERPACNAVTCDFSGACTLRGSATLSVSPAGETSYQRSCSAGPATSGNIRLTSNNAVQYLHSGEWRYVCDDSWDINDATVACRELGLGSATAALSFLTVANSFWMDNVACSGSESTLADCSRNAWGNENCGTTEGAGVTCSGTSSAGTSASSGTPSSDPTIINPDLASGLTLYAYDGNEHCYRIIVGGRVDQVYVRSGDRAAAASGGCDASLNYVNPCSNDNPCYYLGAYSSTTGGTTQNYLGGSSCPNSNPDRSASLQMRAQSGATRVTAQVNEPSTCFYEIVLYGPTAAFTNTAAPLTPPSASRAAPDAHAAADAVICRPRDGCLCRRHHHHPHRGVHLPSDRLLRRLVLLLQDCSCAPPAHPRPRRHRSAASRGAEQIG